MPGGLRLCLDLDVLVAAMIAEAKRMEGTIPVRLLSVCLDGRFGLVTSDDLLWELTERLMGVPLRLSRGTATLRANELADVAERLLPRGDVLETARRGGADYLITYRRDRYPSAAAGPNPPGGFTVLHVREAPAELALP